MLSYTFLSKLYEAAPLASLYDLRLTKKPLLGIATVLGAVLHEARVLRHSLCMVALFAHFLDGNYLRALRANLATLCLSSYGATKLRTRSLLVSCLGWYKQLWLT